MRRPPVLTVEERQFCMAMYGVLYRLAFPEKKRAHNVVGNSIRNGTLTRQPCKICGNPDSHAHHEDHTKPLDIKWLCAKCHRRRHVWNP